TRFSRDWSSDVCSSDLSLAGGAMGLYFRCAHLGGNLVEYAVDEFVGILSTKFLGEGDGFVDYHLVGNVQAVFQFVAAHAQQRLEIGRASWRERVWITGG